MPIPPYDRSDLDAGTVLKYAFDETTGRLRVDAQVTANISGAQEIVISHTDDSIQVGDGVNLADVVDSSLQVMNMGQLVPRVFDYIAASYPNSTTEVYTYKTGGSGGTTVATVTVVYTDSTKENVSTVTKV